MHVHTHVLDLFTPTLPYHNMGAGADAHIRPTKAQCRQKVDRIVQLVGVHG